MSSLRPVAAFALAATASLSLAGCGINSVPTAEENAKARWADVQNQYQRRADLIPNLVETVKGYATHETTAFDRVTQARAAALGGFTAVAPMANTDPVCDAAAVVHEVRAAAASYLWWPILMPLASVWAYTYDGVYLAATRTRIMRNTMIGAFMIFLTLLYGLMPLIGNHALWLAVSGFLTGRGLLLHMAYPLIRRSF